MNEEYSTALLGGKEYTFTMLPAEYSVVLFAKIVDMFGAGMAKFVPALFEDYEDMSLKELILKFSDLGAEVLPMISPDKMKPICDALIPMTLVTDATSPNGKRCTYDDFNGNVLNLYKVVFLNMRFNYADFFSVLLPKVTSLTGVE